LPCLAEQSQAVQQEAKRQETIKGKASKPDNAAFSKAQKNTPGSLLDAVVAPVAQQVSKQQHSQPVHQLSVQSGARADRHHDR